MDIHAVFKEVARWCAQQSAAGDPTKVEVDCDAAVWVTIGESAPPWHVRRARRCSSGASVPLAQLRYDVDSRTWTLHHRDLPQGWCDEEDAVRDPSIGALLDEIASDREGRFQGLPPGYVWPFDRGRDHAA